MNIRHLEILEAISLTGTFTGAAQKLFLTQSAVSHAVAELEAQTKTPLFDRLPKGVRLTRCGMLLLEEAHGILASCRSLEERMGRLDECAPIQIVSSITIASFCLPQFLKSLEHLHPTLPVNVSVVTASCALDTLKRGEADIAFIEGTRPQGPFHSVLFGSYSLWAACAPSYPLPDHPLSPAELCTFPLLLREKGSAIRDAFDSMLYLAGQTARPAWESVNSGALIKAAQAGLGITVLPDLLLQEPAAQKQLRLIELDGIVMNNQMSAVYNRDKYITPSLQAVLDVISPAPF